MTTAKQRAYQKIHEAILQGVFAPGFQLKEVELCTICEVSRTPVRQALRMLASEGLVEIRNNGRKHIIGARI